MRRKTQTGSDEIKSGTSVFGCIPDGYDFTGICHSIPKDGNRNWDFLHAADTLLYQVKKKNRNSLCIGDINGQEFKADFT